MYTAVLMLALSAGAETADHGRRGCNGCNGCSGYYSSCSCSRYYHSGCSCSGGYVYRSGYYGAYSYAPGSNYYTYPNGVAQAPNSDPRRSFYFDPNQQPAAMVRVLVPNPEAEIWFDNATTQQRGMERVFLSPPLESGRYVYTIKARWMDNGRPMTQDRRVELRPGETVTVDFRSEQVPGPSGPEQLKPLPKDKTK